MNYIEALYVSLIGHNWSILCQNILIQKVNEIQYYQNNVFISFFVMIESKSFNVVFFIFNPFLLSYLSICIHIYYCYGYVVNDCKQKLCALQDWSKSRMDRAYQ